jgi:hypothetical protein
MKELENGGRPGISLFISDHHASRASKRAKFLEQRNIKIGHKEGYGLAEASPSGGTRVRESNFLRTVADSSVTLH